MSYIVGPTFDTPGNCLMGGGGCTRGGRVVPNNTVSLEALMPSAVYGCDLATAVRSVGRRWAI